MRVKNRLVFILVVCAVVPSTTWAQKKTESMRTPISIEQVVSRPAPGLSSPRKLQFHPDGSRLTFLKPREGSLVQDLWAYDLKSGESAVLLAAETLGGGAVEGDLSLEEELRRARLRELAEGLTDYSWAQDGKTLLLPVRGDLFLWKEGDGIHRVTDTPKTELDARLSTDGETLLFVREGQLFAMKSPFAPGTESPITPAPVSGTAYGVAEYIAQEEFGRMTGYWLSPEGDSVVYTHIDEREVTQFPIVHQGGDPWGPPTQEMHRYPFAGEVNAQVRLLLQRFGEESVVTVEIPGLDEGYLLDVQWMPEGGEFLVAVMNRVQQQYSLFQVKPDGKSEVLVREQSGSWLDRPGPVEFMMGEGGEVKGLLRVDSNAVSRRVQAYDIQKRTAEYMTSEEGHVDRILWVDEESFVYEGHLGDPRERQIIRVLLADGTSTVLSEKGGWNYAVFHPEGSQFLHYRSSLREPLQVFLKGIHGERLATLHRPDPTEWEPLQLQPPEPFEVTASDGSLMYGHLYKPSGSPPEGGWPAILAPYGGPTHQVVRDTWSSTVSLRRQYLARQGFVVLALDNRGTPRRESAFSKAHYLRLGTVEVEDQVAAARALVTREGVNPERIGIMGWSYGGYLAALCLAKAPETFAAAVAGAPVIDWRGYDTGYTERYMATPQANQKGYDEGSVLTHLSKIEGQMLVIHGMIDENVHFRHSAALIEGLLREGKRHDVIVYPAARHSPRRKSEKMFVFEKMVDWLRGALSADGSSSR